MDPTPLDDSKTPGPTANPPREGDASAGGASAGEDLDAVPSEAGPIEATGSPAEVAELRAKVAALEDKVRRQAAEFVNDTRRIRAQGDERVRFAAETVVSDLLGVVDALHNGIEGLKDSEHERRVAEGLRLVERELLDVLARHGVRKIEALGRPFDPAVHEAILEMEGPGAPKSVLQVLRPGFTLHGRVVRPAHVIVNKGGTPKTNADAGAGRGEAPEGV